MGKTQRELAYLRDLAVDGEWTQRFADLVDKYLDLGDTENLLYINAGTGGHAISIFEKFGEKANIFATCEDEDILTIARDKAAALSADVDFSMMRFEDNAFDAVLADASLKQPAELEEFIEDVVRVARTSADLAVFLPTAGSYGEIVSLLWEVLFTEDLGEHGTAAEKIITDMPSVSRLEEIAERVGFVNINTETVIELFEYDNGKAFVSSPLVADFLLPAWLDMLDENEKERVTAELARLIDVEDGELTFRFSIKATLLTGEKG